MFNASLYYSVIFSNTSVSLKTQEHVQQHIMFHPQQQQL